MTKRGVKAAIALFFFCISFAATAQNGWPRTVAGAKGSVTLSQAPTRIVSTSVTLTGSLLAIDAPVIAS
ncbi:MAG: Fe2+-enterobactin ABC transporter substrate-binding protein, partial [Pantoea sp.]|nr:Fe2+-enterobactin ABC transporter substrate-binding protein [Pantoea sp.]